MLPQSEANKLKSITPTFQSSPTSSHYSTLDHRPRNGLELDWSDFRSLAPRKREYIDLTGDDDNDEAHTTGRKKSRTSSSSAQSTQPSIDTPLHSSEISRSSSRLDFKPGRPIPSARPVRPIPESKPVRPVPSAKPGSNSKKYASAVVIPPALPSPRECRRQFCENLKALGQGVDVFNNVDDTSPPLSFQFALECKVGKGVHRTTAEFMSGCNCRKDNGRQIGCEYLSCECLDDSDLNADGKRVFPYSASKLDFGCLRSFYLESRHHIYECNPLCNCESNCKNRVVQHGRVVPLQIFKTTNRGWGLRCIQDLKKGQFIDTYRGEIITNDEANSRHEHRNIDQDIYLMDFDKWTEEEGAAGYVCDGMHIGGPTRFINHSCDPNCGLYTVSYNHADKSIYDLAFFATEAIPKGTELTFDYVGEEDLTPITEQRADELEREKGYRPARCLCGTAVCRGYFFN